MKTNEVNIFKNKIYEACDKKKQLFEHSFFKYCIRSTLAGAFLALASLAAFATANSFKGNLIAFEKISFALIFAFGLVYILNLGGELATSNMMYLRAGLYYKKVRAIELVKILAICILFNLIGSILVAWLADLSGLLDSFTNESLLSRIVENKLTNSSSNVFFGSILANVFVNIAILSWLFMNSQSGKTGIIMSAIFMFVILGYDHLIANFGSFSMAYFAGLNITSMTVGNVLAKWGITLVGNYIGGGIIIGLTYAWLHDEK